MLMDTEKLIAYVRNQIGPSKKIFVVSTSKTVIEAISRILTFANSLAIPWYDATHCMAIIEQINDSMTNREA